MHISVFKHLAHVVVWTFVVVKVLPEKTSAVAVHFVRLLVFRQLQIFQRLSLCNPAV